MESREQYIRIYTGSKVNVLHLQELLSEAEIPTRIRDDFDAGLRAGFGGGLPGQVQLFCSGTHHEEAKKIVEQTFPESP